MCLRERMEECEMRENSPTAVFSHADQAMQIPGVLPDVSKYFGEAFWRVQNTNENNPPPTVHGVVFAF